MTDSTGLPAEAPLRRDLRFLLLFGARVVSVLGNGFARVAPAFAVLALPGASGSRLSLVPACRALPQLLFILVGGVVAFAVGTARAPAGWAALVVPATAAALLSPQVCGLGADGLTTGEPAGVTS